MNGGPWFEHPEAVIVEADAETVRAMHAHLRERGIAADVLPAPGGGAGVLGLGVRSQDVELGLRVLHERWAEGVDASGRRAEDRFAGDGVAGDAVAEEAGPCPACGAELAPGAERCTACGLRFA